MSPNLTARTGFTTNHSADGQDLPRSHSGVHRLPQIRTNWVSTNVELPEAGTTELSTIATEVANAVEQATLQYRENNSWVQLELDLWRAVTSTVEKWRRQSPAPALAHRPHSAESKSSRGVVGPVRFQLRHR